MDYLIKGFEVIMRLKQANVMSPQYRISQKHSFIEKCILRFRNQQHLEYICAVCTKLTKTTLS